MRKEIERLPVMNLEVTEVKIFPFDTSGIGGNVKAVANVKINDVLEIKDIKIIQSNNGYFIQMPMKKNKAGEFVPVVNPLSRELYLHIRRKILDEYRRVLEKYDRLFNEERLTK
jgi:stage V sporulation protein G